MDIPVFKFALREGLSDLYLPTRADNEATGWDVRCAPDPGLTSSFFTIASGEYIKIPLGFRVFSPKGWWLELKPRSSSFIKKELHALYGTIDESFEGECMFCCQFIPEGFDKKFLRIDVEERIGQLIPVKRQEMIVEKISNEEYDLVCEKRGAVRRSGGFGSTGDK